MKKITLEFTGDDLENGQIAIKATDLWLALSDVNEKIRAIKKYDTSEETMIKGDWAEGFHEDFWEILENYNITLEELS